MSFTTIEAHGERPLTVNRVAGMHRQAWARHTKQTREEWFWLAKQAKVPRLQAATIIVTPLHADRSSPQDVAACAPEAKAAIDGLVDAGLLPNDTAVHLLEVIFRPPLVCGVNGLRIEVRDMAVKAETAPRSTPRTPREPSPTPPPAAATRRK